VAFLLLAWTVCDLRDAERPNADDVGSALALRLPRRAGGRVSATPSSGGVSRAERAARAAWSRIAEPADERAFELVAEHGAVDEVAPVAPADLVTLAELAGEGFGWGGPHVATR
jgi:hypothetical protein